MTVTMTDMQPVSLSMVTQDLFDSRRFQKSFGDNLILRGKDKSVEDMLVAAKRELNASVAGKKFLDGYKIVIINNIDKILALVSTRYANIDHRSVEEIVMTGKDLMKRVMFADNFDQIASLEPTFRSKVHLPTYH